MNGIEMRGKRAMSPWPFKS